MTPQKEMSCYEREILIDVTSFIAATKMIREGNGKVALTRATATAPSSNGWRKTSKRRVDEWNLCFFFILHQEELYVQPNQIPRYSAENRETAYRESLIHSACVS